LQNNQKIIAVIPARMGSSRFPGKPLKKILGIPMIEHVRRRVEMSKILDEVFVATCDQEIYDTVNSFNGNAIMTSNVHERASDRVAEVATKINADIFVLVQGDEPMIYPEMINLAVEPMLKDSTITCVNLTKQITTEEEWKNPNTIKVVTDKSKNALYFSRQSIPTIKNFEQDNMKLFKQVCIIPFRKNTILKYAELDPTPLEISESIDMMRFLEHGYKVRMIETEFDTFSVDTPTDLVKIEKLIKTDHLIKEYIS
tara:strand:- start:8657 stop:9424 length:768 start_codon:yes stop_codon:yes gene_type:complete